MDPLIVSASIVTLIDTTNAVISCCRNYSAAVKDAPWAVSRTISNLRSLRSVLESLEQLVSSDEARNSVGSLQLETVQSLELKSDGPLATELNGLESKLRPPKWAGPDGSKRKAFAQSLAWPFKERETEKVLQRIESLKSSLELALSKDQRYTD